MIVSYCKKCRLESAGKVCPSCGKKASAASVRDVWRTVRVPAADGAAWRSLILVLLLCTALLALLLLGAERLMNTAAHFQQVYGSILTLTLLAPLVGLLIGAAALLLQGREEIRYSLDTTGAHTQTWHRFSHIRSWARLQGTSSADAVEATDGTKFVMSDERHILWQDVNEIKYSPASGTIRLYHTPHLAPLTLRIPPDEYETAELIVKKYAKLKD